MKEKVKHTKKMRGERIEKNCDRFELPHESFFNKCEKNGKESLGERI